MKQIWNFILENWDVIAPIVYEIIVRVIPTKKNLSLIDNGWKLLNFVITNKRKPHGNEQIASIHGKTKNIVNVRIDKHILTVLLFLTSCVSLAQINQTGKGYFSYNANDSTFIKNTRQTYQTNNGNAGVIWFDEWQNKWRAWNGNEYVDLINNSGGTLTFDSLPFVTPEHYGALGDGTTNDATAIQSAINSGKPVFFSEKNYRVNTSILLPSYTQIFGSGQNSIISTTANISILSVNGINTSISNITLDGNNSGTSQYGISAIGDITLATDRFGNQISNCRFQDLGGAGVYSQYVVGDGPTQHQGAFYIINSIATNCLNGFYFNTQSEYNTISNSVAYLCTTGFRNIGGNNTWNAGSITDNAVGVFIGSGTNDGHGVISGVKINHNTNNIYAQNTILGFLFSGCMVYSGSVTIDNADGIRFDACEFSVNNLFFTNADVCIFNGNKFVITPTLNITGTNPIFFNNYFTTGVIPNNYVNTLQSKTFFTANATLAGLNSGSFAGDPSTVVNGDAWYNSTLGQWRFRQGGSTISIGTGTIGGSTALNFVAVGAGPNTLTNDPDFIYNTTNNSLLVENILLDNNTISVTGSNLQLDASGALQIVSLVKHNFTTDATDAGLNLGQFAGVPSNSVNADLTYNTNDHEIYSIQNGTPYVIARSSTLGLANESIAIGTGDGARLTDNPSLTFNTGTNTLSTANLTITQGAVTSGTYTPTLTFSNPPDNISAMTPYPCQYIRVGNVVTVSGRFEADFVTGGGVSTQFWMSLPIASNIAQNYQVGGTACGETTGVSFPTACWQILGGITQDAAEFNMKAFDTTNEAFNFSFTYLIL